METAKHCNSAAEIQQYHRSTSPVNSKQQQRLHTLFSLAVSMSQVQVP
jgi:hypothetical protein